MAKIPLAELPIRIFRAIDGSNQHLALICAGSMHFTFIADTAMQAKRKAKTFVEEQSAKARAPAKRADAGAE